MRLLYTCFCCCLLFSCAEDLGNYDYRDLTEPDITGGASEISVLLYDKLQLNPELGSQEFTPDRYAFEWKVLAATGSGEAIVIGDTRNLDYRVELIPGLYTLYFTVTEKATGVFWQKSYSLQVNQVTSEGWMVLCSEGGRVRLDMISAVTGTTYRDILKDNGIPFVNGPRRIQSLREDLTDEDSPFYLLTDEGATRLGKNNFEWKEEYSFRYEMANGQPQIPYSITPMAGGKIFVGGTKAYFADCFGISGVYGSAINKDFDAAPFVGTNISTVNIMVPIALIYDRTHKRFMGYSSVLASSDFGFLEPLQELKEMGVLADELAASGKARAGVVGNAFDRFPQGFDYVYMENTLYDPGNAKMGITYTVLADGSKRYVYGIQLGDMLTFGDCTFILGKAYYGDLSACTGIGQVTDLFAFSSLKNYMYYAVGNTVYRVDLSVKPLKAQAQFTLAGEKITCLKFNLYRDKENVNRSYDLVVGSLKGEEGMLRIYEGYDSDGDFRTVKPVTYEGFAEIVDATYREMLE